MNQTKIHVPSTAAAKAKTALLQSVDPGMNSSAISIPSWAEDMVAPVVGETNLFMHSCCIIRPATLMPIPVQSMARSRGRRDMRKILHCSPSPESSPDNSTYSTPMNSDTADSTSRAAASMTVDVYFFILGPPYPAPLVSRV